MYITVSYRLIVTCYADMSIQYAAMFKDCKNDNFWMKKNDIFLIFAQTNEAVLTNTQNLCFKAKI